MENYNPIKDNWEAIKIELKLRYPQLTDGDLELVDGYELETFKNLQAKTGKNKEEFFSELKSIAGEQ